MATDRGTANYNALQAKVEKRVASGLAFGAGWTYSKSLDNGASGFYDVENGPGGFAVVQNYNDLSQDYGTSGNSLTHIVYGWAIYELPFGKGKRFMSSGIGAAILGGWQTNLNLSAHSGIRFTFPMLVSTRQTSGIPRALLTMAGQTLLETQDSATLPSRRHSIRRLSPIQSTSTATPGEASSRVRHTAISTSHS